MFLIQIAQGADSQIEFEYDLTLQAREAGDGNVARNIARFFWYSPFTLISLVGWLIMLCALFHLTPGNSNSTEASHVTFLHVGSNITIFLYRYRPYIVAVVVCAIFFMLITSFTDASNKGKWKCSERAFDDYRKYSPKCLERWSEMKNLINTKEQKGKDCNDSR
jgi:hypothetical protein